MIIRDPSEVLVAGKEKAPGRPDALFSTVNNGWLGAALR